MNTHTYSQWIAEQRYIQSNVSKSKLMVFIIVQFEILFKTLQKSSGLKY